MEPTQPQHRGPDVGGPESRGQEPRGPQADRHPVRVVDSHTEGEPTRVFLDDARWVAGRSVAELLAAWRNADGGWSVPHDLLTMVAEPRAVGSPGTELEFAL